MGVERELKVRLSRQDLARLLEWLNGRCNDRGREEQVDIYFQHPCRDFGATDEALRLRTRKGADRVELCYKGPREGGHVKSREEIEVSVGSAGDLSRILSRLGFEPVAEVIKRRETFDCGDVVVYVDHVEGLGTFAEFEARGAGQTELRRLVESLGLLEKTESRTYLELLLERRRQARQIGV